MMKTLLLDDHPLVRSALESVIRSLDQDMVVMSAATANQARALLSEQGPVDLALLDLQLPDADGFGLLIEWRRRFPDMPVVVVSGSEQPSDVVRALEEGARGFIPKRTANEVLMQALRMVLSGGIYVPPMALSASAAGHGLRDGLAAIAQAHEPPAAPLHRPTAPPASASSTSQLRLTPRQSEVLELLLQGQPNKLIARQLNLSVETVKDHVASLLRVLGVSSRTQAVLAVSQMMGASGAPPLAVLARPQSLAGGRPSV